jgi:hypothetical protein
VDAKARIGLLCEVSTAFISWICNGAKLDRMDIPGAILQYFNKITQVRRKAKSDQLCLQYFAFCRAHRLKIAKRGGGQPMFWKHLFTPNTKTTQIIRLFTLKTKTSVIEVYSSHQHLQHETSRVSVLTKSPSPHIAPHLESSTATRALGLATMPFAQLVLGSPGSGKSTYCNGSMLSHLSTS